VIVVSQPRDGFAAPQGVAATERVSVIWEYSTDLFEQATMERMGRDYLSLLRSCSEEPMRAWSDFAVVSENEARAIACGPAIADASRREASLTDLWLEQVARSPNTLAVRDVHGAWTYRDVAVVANQLAHLLQGRGVEREEPVGICFPRGRAAVACM